MERWSITVNRSSLAELRNANYVPTTRGRQLGRQFEILGNFVVCHQSDINER